MTQPTFIALRAELPWKKWHQDLDLNFALFVMLSLMMHVAATQYLRFIPKEQFPELGISPLEIPLTYPTDERIITIPKAIDLPAFETTPAMVETASGPAVSPEPGTGATQGGRSDNEAPPNGAASRSAGPGGVVGILSDHPEIITAITSRGNDEGYAEMAARISPNSSQQVPAGRLAHGGRDLPAGALETKEVGIALDVPGASAPGVMQLPEHKERRVGVRFDPPASDAIDAATNELVRQALRARLSGVRVCYEKQLKVHTNLAGSVRMLVVFSEDGRVRSVQVLNDGLGNAAMTSCIAGVLGRANTGRPLGKTVSVRVPYVFTAVE